MWSGRGATVPTPVWPSDEASERLRTALRATPRGLFCDIDGVLSPIASTPDAARLQPGATEALGAVRASFDLVAIVSGRAARDAWRMVNVAGLLYIGNHGFERMATSPTGAEAATLYPPAAPWPPVIAIALDEARQRIAPQVPEALFEAKGATATIHWRLAADSASAERVIVAIAQETAARHGLRVTPGRMALELRPPVPMDKGVAVASVARDHGLRGAIYLGDDHTDLDAFRALRSLAGAGDLVGVSVAVLHDEAPPELAREADVTLASLRAVPRLLRWLAAQARPDREDAPESI